MKKAYLILAHKGPEQVHRLIEKLDDGTSFFYVHIDTKSDIRQFESLNLFSDKLQFVPRAKADWGSLGIVEAMLNGLRAIRQADRGAEHFILLSGQDYPIKSNSHIDRFLSENKKKIFLEYFSLPDPAKWKPNGGLYRVNKYYMGLDFRQRYTAKAVNLAARFLPFLRRKVYNSMKPYAGSMWWILDKEALNYILDFVDGHPGYWAFHRFTFAPDEVFFHTILLNAAKGALSSEIINNDRRFIRWKDMSASHPELIGRHYFEELKATEALFARKFDQAVDPDILDLIDDHFLTREKQVQPLSSNPTILTTEAPTHETIF
ncbi:MAG TPA: beta-1,6-N-acetylglucosaminyltransferase [Flavisolibacter sp.]|nr:beta-1,6-N-acetylglucosaminyltransferase [Flavisolibacter sp.]